MFHAISGIVRRHRNTVCKITRKKSLAGAIRLIIRHAFQPWKAQAYTSGLQRHSSVEIPRFAFHNSLARGGGDEWGMGWLDGGTC